MIKPQITYEDFDKVKKINAYGDEWNWNSFCFLRAYRQYMSTVRLLTQEQLKFEYLWKSLKIAHLSSSKILSMIMVIIKNNIPRMMSFVNVITVSKVKILVKLGVIKANPNQAAEIFPVIADNDLRNASLVLVTKIF